MPKPQDIPACPSKPSVPRVNAHTYDIELITPMFGGGVETRINDPSFAIRPTSIRGQLQFWWRATVGARYEKLDDLRAAQSAVWGDTTQASRVQVRVEDVRATEPEPCARYEMDRNRFGTFRSMPTWNAPFNNTALPYALFPFQGQLAKGRTRIEVEPASFIQHAKFKLTVICDKRIDFVKEVEPALWAWVNFGGLGSRTRRGCGAIICNTLAPKNKDDLKAMWLRYMPTLFPEREWPTLAAAFLVGSETNNPIEAWNQCIQIMQKFRQAVGLGRNLGSKPNRPGRSRWPEPETIRRVTGQRNGRHGRLPQIPDDAFPRAELGLPIVFHFQNDPQDRPKDPCDVVLYPTDGPEGKRERMASPLILKPLALANGKAVPLILRLKTPALTRVDLRIKKKDLSSLRQELADQVRRTIQPNDNEGSLPLPDPTRLVDPSLSNYPNSPLAMSPNGSALEAFLAYAKSPEFTEVTR
jgi:CRISPR-associated protein Cmr1